MFSRLTTLTPLEKQDNAMESADPNAMESATIQEDANTMESATIQEDANTMESADQNAMESADPNAMESADPNAMESADQNAMESVANNAYIPGPTNESINVIENPTHISEDVFTLSPDSSPNRSWNSTPDLDSVYIYHTNNDYNYREFFYLHENRLDKEYACYGTKNIHICTFVMNHGCSYQEDPLPFLQFLLIPSENKWVFPHFKFQCSQQLDFENALNYFINVCTNCMLNSFVIEGHLQEMENIVNLYRGYIECGENDVVVVFDMTSFMEFKLRQQAIWFLVSEVANQNLVSSFVSDFFGKHGYMTRIETQHNVVVELPRMLYLYHVERREHVKHPLTMLEPRSFHPSYGHFYYFVKEHPVGSPQQYVRCAVFMENVTVIDEVFEYMTNHSDSPSSLAKDLGVLTPEIDDVEEGSRVISNNDEILSDLDEQDEGSRVPSEDDEILSELGDIPSEDEEILSESDDSINEFLDEVKPAIVTKPSVSSHIMDVSSLLPFSSIVIFSEGDTKLWCVKTESLFVAI